MFDMDAQARYFGVTAVENIFLTEYMPAAKGEYVKVYLAALYHAARPDEKFGVEELAQELSIQPSEAEAALRYWERRGLLSLIAGEKPTYRLYSMVQRVLSGQDRLLKPDEDYVAFAESVYALFGDQRKVTPSEISLAYEWVQDVGLPQEAVLLLLSHMKATRGVRFSFKRAQELAARMKEDGVADYEQAEDYLRFEGEILSGAKAVLRRMRQFRLPSEDEMLLYKKWREEWGLLPDMILESCAETTAATNPSFKYLDKVLEHRAGRTKQEISESEELMRRANELKSALGSRGAASSIANVYRDMARSMPHEVILLAASECARRGKHGLDDVEGLLGAWEERGLKTAQAVRDYLSVERPQNLFLKKMFEAAGHRGEPTQEDRKRLSAWRSRGAQDDLLLLAASRAAQAEGAKMRYAETLIDSWLAEGAHTAQEAAALSSGYKAAKAQNNPKNAYEQRTYTDDELERAAGTDELLKEAREQ